MSPHISEQFDLELAQIRDRFMEMGGLVEALVRNAASALLNHDAELAQQVRDGDKPVNRLEVEIDELCVHTIARRQPAASDLRTVISIMKASTDLERIGDEAGRIAKMAQALAVLDYPSDQYRDFREMAELAEVMVARSLDAFARQDADGALEVIASDEPINECYKVIVKARASGMRADPSGVDRGMNVIWAARALERIGDHAKNICEYLVFQVKGEDVRHAGKANPAS
jgi:phosphate transport system protein